MSKSIIKSFGILTDSLQDTKLIEQLNIIVRNPLYCPIVFCSNPANFNYQIQPQFSIMQMHHAIGFEHPLISTNIYTTNILKECFSCSQKFFIVKEPEWAKMPNLIYAYLSSLYNNNEIELIAYNDNLFNLLKNLWKTPKKIINNWNENELISLINNLYE